MEPPLSNIPLKQLIREKINMHNNYLMTETPSAPAKPVLGKFAVFDYMPYGNCFLSLEDAKAEIDRRYKDRPYTVEPHFIYELKEVTVPEKPDVKLDTLTFDEFKKLEDKKDDIQP